MNATAPVEVGTRGTIGSLLRKEIEYFKRHDHLKINNNRGGNSIKQPHQRQTAEMASDGTNSWRGFSSLMMKLKRKKRRNNGVAPGICSMVEISHSHRINEIPGFSYRSLRDELEKSEF